ncbi:MAG: methyltransferase domain-containing protein [Pyrinomonadaceae bacterium]
MNETHISLGIHDAFKDVASWNNETSEAWITALNLRSTSADQIELRARLIDLARLASGDIALEIGCGTGALLCDLAGIVGAKGKVIGIEPQPALARVARQNISSENLSAIATVKNESAERIFVQSEIAAACFAQTVLIHFPEQLLKKSLMEMVRVVRRGGRIISVDQDGDTWTIDHPDRELTRRIVRFNSDQRFADGWTGRRLRRLFRGAGLEEIEVQVLVQTDTDKSSYLFGMAERIATTAAEVGEITIDECQNWLEQLNRLAEEGNFFSSINYYICAGTRNNSVPNK